ncbi:MAG TPA: phosphoribosylaminoimidazolesuccinocarboxamide synthase [Flavobacteriales bacterium]|jgi:phosphoribosylaminoimidazole-succinocarboxamide synthase|nr:phosphoribosylaminoimidazolesuccinocarboxamide synthase [Flavobacteriales bacterium]|tara:strand:- start:523 stop:1470 length:948 start_codon:yes stop_codon:yes gene_type:complete
MTSTIVKTEFNFPKQTKLYKGKVRDVYTINDDKLIMIATDRISAFDCVLPKGIPFKGQVLNQIASSFLKATNDIVPNWLEATPDPSVSVGKRCEPFKVEMVIRGYLTGHAWREYRDGKRTICGVPMPNGMKENDKFPIPILTPTTKAEVGHDEDISREEILAQELVSEQDYVQLEDYTKSLFVRGTEMAAQRGLILVDTKYEFGKDSEGIITLIDEIHTPDSSRYFFKEGYQQSQDRGEKQKQLSKEFVRQWLIENGFQGKEGQSIPFMSDEFVDSVSERYIELFEHITGEKFVKQEVEDVLNRVENNILSYLNN